MDRRIFIAGAAGLAAVLRRRAAARATNAHLAIAEYDLYRTQPADKVKRRFDLYQQIGFGLLRSGIGWWGLEQSPGEWSAPPALERYFSEVIRSGFRLKLLAGVLDAPPRWFVKAHPDSELRDAFGGHSGSLSLWYPGLDALLAEKTDMVFAYLADSGLLKYTDFIFVDLGYAGQPTYPVRIIGKAGCGEASPWFYDSHAEAAFRQAMRKKYSSVVHANRVWGTNFADWGAVRPPRPRQHPGTLWADALLWYRDSKRAVDRSLVDIYRRALDKHTSFGRRPSLIVMVAGSHIIQPEWSHAVDTGLPDCSIAIMSDSEFAITLAKETGCWLQYTGVENAPEVAYLRKYMTDHAVTEPMWGENAGVESVARRPARIVDVILANNLYGLDYVSSRFLFAPDGVTPNPTFHRLAQACRRLRRSLH